MPRGVANAKQLAMMEKVLDGYSQRYSLTHPDDLDDAAALILDLFNAVSAKKRRSWRNW